MKIYEHKIVKRTEWLDKDTQIYNELYTSEIILFGFIKWSVYTVDCVHNVSKVKSNNVTGFNNKPTK